MKNLLRHIFLLFIAAVLPAMNYAAQPAQSAESILAALQDKVRAAAAIDAAFTINGGGGPVEGSVQMAGSKFAMTTPKLSVWYDGHTQWTMLTASQEVSITEPTAAELVATNPFAILTSRQSHYTVRRHADSNGCRVVALTPRDKSSGIDTITLFINATTGWPQTVIITFEDSNIVEVIIDNIAATKAKPANVFVYDPKRYPAVEVVDLR